MIYFRTLVSFVRFVVNVNRLLHLPHFATKSDLTKPL